MRTKYKKTSSSRGQERLSRLSILSIEHESANSLRKNLNDISDFKIHLLTNN